MRRREVRHLMIWHDVCLWMSWCTTRCGITWRAACPQRTWRRAWPIWRDVNRVPRPRWWDWGAQRILKWCDVICIPRWRQYVPDRKDYEGMIRNTPQLCVTWSHGNLCYAPNNVTPVEAQHDMSQGALPHNVTHDTSLEAYDVMQGTSLESDNVTVSHTKSSVTSMCPIVIYNQARTLQCLIDGGGGGTLANFEQKVLLILVFQHKSSRSEHAAAC